MQSRPDYDVIVAGGGMVGLSMALALAATGLRLALVEQQRPQGVAEVAAQLTDVSFDSRVSALTPASVALLRRLGVWQALVDLRVSPYTRMHVWDGDGTAAIDFDARDLHVEALGWITENSLVSAVLVDALARHGVACHFERGIGAIERERNGYRVYLDQGDSLSCALLIGADGGRSRIRAWAGVRTRQWSYEQQALVTTVRTEKPHQATAWQRFMRSGPLALLPLRPGEDTAQHYCSVVWSCTVGLAAELLALEPEAFATRLAQAFEHRLGALELLAAVRSFPLHQLHAVDYVAPHLALVGDAAHTIHPLAGQGVNLGLADVEVLAEVIREALAQGRDYGALRTLSRYQRARKPANLGTMLGMEGFKQLFGSDDLTLRWLRNTGLRLADNVGPLKQTLMRRAMGLR